MDSFKERAKDYAEEAKDKGDEALAKAGVPRWLWPTVYAVVLIVAVAALIQVFG